MRKVLWQGANGPVPVLLTDTLVAPDAAMSLLSVPALTKKDIAVLFLPDKAILFDIQDNNTVLGYAKRADDDLYYINDNQDAFPMDVTGYNSTVHAFIAVATEKQITEDQSTDSDVSTIVTEDENNDSESESDMDNNSDTQSIEFTNPETDSESEAQSSREASLIPEIYESIQSNC